MNITITSPPLLTGDTSKDTQNLHEWCTGFFMQMKRILYSLDSSNITELDASRLNGTVSLGDTKLKGVNITVTGDTFSLMTPDGSQYLTLDGSGLKFKGTVL